MHIQPLPKEKAVAASPIGFMVPAGGGGGCDPVGAWPLSSCTRTPCREWIKNFSLRLNDGSQKFGPSFGSDTRQITPKIL